MGAAPCKLDGSPRNAAIYWKHKDHFIPVCVDCARALAFKYRPPERER